MQDQKGSLKEHIEIINQEIDEIKAKEKKIVSELTETNQVLSDKEKHLEKL